ncbi:metallopeptidase family protein [Granulicoccus phenolivorans]|uniref:metallopeptidase family protein n=1 Tax=Granulicoccus phenolivorans TaxID=266854 RepID=UPI000427F3F1|nr:metallopeptidase family protein [Granulicoccus phenolivorans]
MRGPLALPNAYGPTARPLSPQPREVFFGKAVQTSIRTIQKNCPRALTGIDIGIEDVPDLTGNWNEDRVPLAAAIEATSDRPARLVIYRRPLEHRAHTRRGLQILVYRTVVEQLSALTLIPVHEIDPDGLGGTEEDDW